MTCLRVIRSFKKCFSVTFWPSLVERARNHVMPTGRICQGGKGGVEKGSEGAKARVHVH